MKPSKEVKQVGNIIKGVILSANDENLLDANRNPIAVETVIPQTFPGSGEYILEYFTHAETPAAITINNGADTEDFVTVNFSFYLFQTIHQTPTQLQQNNFNGLSIILSSIQISSSS